MRYTALLALLAFTVVGATPSVSQSMNPDLACGMMGAAKDFAVTPDTKREMRAYAIDCGRNPDVRVCERTIELLRKANWDTFGLVCTGR